MTKQFSILGTSQEAEQLRCLVNSLISRAIASGTSYTIEKPPSLSFLTFRSQLYSCSQEHPDRKRVSLRTSISQQTMTVVPKKAPSLKVSSDSSYLTLYQDLLTELSDDEHLLMRDLISLTPSLFFQELKRKDLFEDRFCLLTFVYLMNKKPWKLRPLHPFVSESESESEQSRESLSLYLEEDSSEESIS